jgi:hypothetical protein
MTEEYDLTFLLLFSHVVFHLYLRATGQTMLQGNESAVGVDGESDSLLFKGFALRIGASDMHTNLH